MNIVIAYFCFLFFNIVLSTVIFHIIIVIFIIFITSILNKFSFTFSVFDNYV